jgi:hypothetical protein
MIDDCEYRSKGQEISRPLGNTNDLGITTKQAVYKQLRWRQSFIHLQLC